VKNKLTTTPSVKQQLVYIMEDIVNILETMNHSEYNVLMRETDMEELLRLSKEAKKLFEEWKVE
tara:strand:- start:959 stop:1150 length:192 start_codon:yes stop_codon:yes gene_type:complete